MEKQRQKNQSLKLYLTQDHKCFQIITPSQEFDGNWGHLISAILISHNMKEHYGFNVL